MENRCVCCGEIITEGRQVCMKCERAADLKPGKIYRRTHKRESCSTQTLCKVLERTENGWRVDLGNGYQAEIGPEDLEGMEEA